MKISVLKQPDVFVREEIDDLKETGKINSGLREENGTIGSSCLSHNSYQPLTVIGLLVPKPDPTQNFPSHGPHLGCNAAKVLGVKEEVYRLPLQTLLGEGGWWVDCWEQNLKGKTRPEEADTQWAAESIRRKNTELRNQVPGFLSHERVIYLRPSHIICKIGRSLGKDDPYHLFSP